MINLVNSHLAEYIGLPVYGSQVDNLVWLYEAQETASLENPNAKVTQVAILLRIEEQFKKNHLPVVELLHRLVSNEGLEQTNINSAQEKVKESDSTLYAEAVAIAAQRQKTRQDINNPAPCLLTAWFKLTPAQQAVLTELAGKLELADVPVLTADDANSTVGQYLFGKVTHMVIASMIERGGIQVCYPSGLSPKEKGEFAKGLMFNDMPQVGDGVQASESVGHGLAAEVEFSFIGNYVKGLQVGVPIEIVDKAMALANNILTRMAGDSKKEKSETSPVNLLLQRKDSPILQAREPQAAVNSPFQVSSAEDSDGAYYTVTVKYGKIGRHTLPALKMILESDYGTNCGDCLVDKTEKSRGKIKVLAFGEEESAKTLVSELQQLLSQKSVDNQPDSLSIEVAPKGKR